MQKKNIENVITSLEAFEIVDILAKFSPDKLEDIARIAPIRLENIKQKKIKDGQTRVVKATQWDGLLPDE